MFAVTKFLAGGAALAALASAAPAAAQYYPGYGNPYGYGTNPYGYGGNPYGYGAAPYGSPYNYGVNSQAVAGQCANAVQARLNGGYSGYGNPYGYGSARVLGISRIEQGLAGGTTVRGVATTGRGPGYGYTPNSPVDLVWKCRTDFRGAIVDIQVSPARSSYTELYTPWNQDYSQYGYQRY